MSDKPSSEDSPQRRRADDVGAPSEPRRGFPLRRASDFGSILVVDDNPDAVEILCRLLGAQRLRTIPAYSGQECLDIARSQPIDLILLDVSMPGMDGLTVCQELAKDDRTRGVPVMLITARDDHETRVAGMRLGVSEFLAKPFNRTELLERVRGQLAGRALARQMDETIKKEPQE
jgi:DNA-binding response OmpR family regulator